MEKERIGSHAAVTVWRRWVEGGKEMHLKITSFTVTPSAPVGGTKG